MKRNALLIGGFVLLAIAIAVVAVFWLSGNSLFGKQLQATIYYRGNVSGLYVGAPVTFRGVPVGQVDDIAIQVDPATARARISVHTKLQARALTFSGTEAPTPDVSGMVARGLRARLVSQSFVTGQKSIDLDIVQNAPPALPSRGDQPEIPALDDRFGALVDQVADLPLRDTVEEMRQTVKELSKTLAAARDTLTGVKGTLDAAAGEVSQLGNVSRETLRTATQAIRAVQQNSETTLVAITRLSDTSRETVQNAAPELQRTIAGAREAAESARVAMNRVTEMTAPGASLRGDLDASVRDLSLAARSLRDWSELLEEKPNAIIFGNKRE